VTETTKHALQNALIFVEDVSGGKPPYPFTDEKIQYTSSFVSVACLHEIDGETELVLGPVDDVAPDFDPAFDGMIETPSRELVLTTVPGEKLLMAKVPDTNTRIRVWRNHPVWADKVVIGWG
jgi:hypothetical protein